MKQSSTLLLKSIVSLVGIAVLAFCIFVLPQTIGSISWGGYDPILIGMYITAVPFFIAVYQILKLLGYIDNNKAFSNLSVKALKNIKYCAFIISAFYGLAMPYIFYVAEQDDAPGVVLIGLVFTFAPLVVGVFAAVLEKLLQNAIKIHSENELTV